MSGQARTPSAEALRCSRYAPTDHDTCAFCGSLREEHPPSALVWHAAPELADALEILLADVRGSEVVGWIPIIWVPSIGGGRQEAGSFIASDHTRAALRKTGRLK